MIELVAPATCESVCKKNQTMQSRFDSSRHFFLHEIPTILARKLGISCKEIPRGKQGNFKFQTKEDAAQTAAGHTVTLIPPLQKIPSPGTPGTHSSGHRPRPVHVIIPGQTVGSLRCEQIWPVASSVWK